MAGDPKKRVATVKAAAAKAAKKARKARRTATRAAKGSKGTKAERRARKLEQRRKEKKAITPAQWNEPAPSHLVAKLDVPRISSKYQSYFEFAENSEKKEKKLEFKVTNDATPPPGFVFVPIGDPMLTQKCKEMSREQDAMIFIVSNKGKEEGSKISEHIYRTGYHFREVIVEAAREIIGETVISKPTAPGFIEPIPDSQEEINEQADGAIRDLFPRIPNTDRQAIIEHAFKKGGKFLGETTVGLQPGIPLSRRVQLAVLAHIRHTHTRYDKLLRETTWMNARKVVEPVCLDVLMKWRGDEETGRDQLDEILREVVVITDSEEDDDDDSSDDETSDEEGEVTSASSTEPPSNTNSRNQQRPDTEPRHIEPRQIPQSQSNGAVPLVYRGRNEPAPVATRTRSKTNPQKDKKRQRGFNRYQAAWNDAISRSQAHQASAPTYNTIQSPAQIAVTAANHNMAAYANNQSLMNYPPNETQRYIQEEQVRYTPAVTGAARPELRYSHPRSPMAPSIPRNEVNMRPAERPLYHSYTQPRGAPPSYVVRERPSQVVRSSPVRHSPQDMPLPSIETSSNIVPIRAGDLHSTLNHSSGVYPRVVEERVQSPLQRQVIVIDDDSPHVKRRRVVREDESSHFRVGPVSSYDNGFHVPTPLRSDSQFVPVSSTQAGGFLVRQPQAPQPAQGLLKHRPSVFVDPATKEELPIFDHPTNNHFARHPTHARPPNDEFASEAQPINSHGMQRPVYANDARREYFQPSFAQHARPVHSTSERVFGYHNSVEDISRYHDKGEYSGNVNRDLVHTFSQSRLHGSAPRPDNEFIVLSDRGNAPRGAPLRYYEDDVPGAFGQASSTRLRSPIRYMERPVDRREQFHTPVTQYGVQERGAQWAQPNYEPRPVPQHQQLMPSRPPVHMPPAQPRQQVVVHE